MATIAAGAALTLPASASALALDHVGSFDRPTYVTSDPGDPNRIFVVELSGQIQLTEGDDTTNFLDIEAIVRSSGDDLGASGDQGLYSMAFSPDYATNHLFYVAYSSADDPATVEDESDEWHLDEFSANGDTADPTSRRQILTIKYPDRIHYGGQLQFGPDRYLYASTGDGGPQEDPDGNAQNLQNLLGKILRIDPEGSAPGEYTVPPDNPFTGAGCTDGCDEIWSYGLRNPWRFSFDRLTGDLVIGDVGYDSWEEVDFAAGPDPGEGDNFGWNCREGAHPGPGETSPVCAAAGPFTEPVFEYPHDDPTHADRTDNAFGCSITGGYVVRDLALGDLYGRYLYADLCVGQLRSLNLGLPTASGDRFEGFYVPNVTSLGEDANCRIYIASITGPVYRLTEAAGGPGAGCQTSSPPEPTPTPGPTAAPDTPLTLDLEAKGQKLRKKLKFFATATADSTLVATGRAVKKTAKELAASQKTRIMLRLKRANRERLQERLDERGKAKVTVTTTATDQTGTTTADRITVRLKG